MMAENVLNFRGKDNAGLVNQPFDQNIESKESENMENIPSRHEVDAKIAKVAAETNLNINEIRKEMEIGFSTTSKDMDVGFAQIRADMANQSKDTIKWAIGLALAIISILLSASIAIFSKIDRPQQNQMQPVIVNIPAQQPQITNNQQQPDLKKN